MKPPSTSIFQHGRLYAAFVAVALAILTLAYGKAGAFLMLNHDLGNPGDSFFHWATYLGDGIMWVPFAMIVLYFKRNYWALLFGAIIISTLITQIGKNVVFKGIQRPFAAITDHSLIHTVPGVEIHTMNSFPSGHTTTAFTLFLLTCLLFNRKWLLPIGLLYACIAGYSRIYLAQHFPIDVSGGIAAAMLTVWISRYLQELWEKKHSKQY